MTVQSRTLDAMAEVIDKIYPRPSRCQITWESRLLCLGAIPAVWPTGYR